MECKKNPWRNLQTQVRVYCLNFQSGFNCKSPDFNHCGRNCKTQYATFETKKIFGFNGLKLSK